MQNLAEALYQGLLLLGYEPLSTHPKTSLTYYVLKLSTQHRIVINIKNNTYSTTMPSAIKDQPIKKNSLTYIHTLSNNTCN